MAKKLFFSLLAAALLCSCGRKAPPFLPVPTAPGRLAVAGVVSDGEGIRITVRVPREIFSLGREEEPWMLARMLRGRTGAEGDLFHERVTRGKTDGFRFGQKLTLVDTGVEEGGQYLYRIELRKRRSRQWVATKTIAVALLPPPLGPEELRVEAREEAIVLSWTGPEGEADGIEYRVLRREREKGESAVTREGLRDTTFIDTRIEREREYCYQVVTVRRTPSETAEGRPSTEVCARTEDRTPPPPPAGLAVRVIEEGVRLSWLPVRADDLLGYNVYRAEGDGPFVKVNREPVTAARYLDASVDRGRRITYRVSAVDDSRQGNESPFSEAVPAVPSR